MPTKVNSKKSSSRATINLPNLSKKDKNKIAKDIKKLTPKNIFIALLLIILGFSIGAGAYYGISKNDCFQLVGEEELTFSLSDTYKDEGVKIIEFNKDISNTAYIETNLKQNSEGEFYAEDIGTYYIKYMTDSIKFGKIFKIAKIRLITFVEESESGE